MNENKKAFFITIINISVVKPEQFCAKKKEKTRRVTLNAIQLSVHFYHYYDSVFPLHFVVFISMKNSVGKILPL